MRFCSARKRYEARSGVSGEWRKICGDSGRRRVNNLHWLRFSMRGRNRRRWLATSAGRESSRVERLDRACWLTFLWRVPPLNRSSDAELHVYVAAGGQFESRESELIGHLPPRVRASNAEAEKSRSYLLHDSQTPSIVTEIVTSVAGFHAEIHLPHLLLARDRSPY